MFEPEAVLHALQNQEPIDLASLPDKHGVYALIDHAGSIRYLGVTENPRMGFRRRIFQYHVTGSEGRSHKFSQAYNTGRMWRSRTSHPGQIAAHAKFAKSVRTKFCRAYCRAAYVEVPRDLASTNYFQYLTRLESQVQQCAPLSMREWEGINLRSVEEPADLVDSLIASLCLSSDARLALDAQLQLYKRERAGDV